MNLSALRTFLAIVETGSLVRASEMLNVTQSTVTARLKSLEVEIGQTLILRHKSGASLTAAGVKLHRYADTISNLWQQARQETGLPDGVSGVCNLACEDDLWPNLGERFAQTLIDVFPNVGLSVWLGSQADVAKWMTEGKSDVAFTYRSATAPQQGQFALGHDDLILVSTDADSPTRFDPGYVYVDAGDAFGREHAIAYADADTARISFGNARVALDHILRVGGSAYLPQRLAQDHLARGALHILAAGPSFNRPFFVTYDKALKAVWPWFDAVLDATATTD